MGCDYYIVKSLYIYYTDNTKTSIEVERDRGYYYYDDMDEDEIDYETKLEEYVQKLLTPKMKPILLYSNNGFVKTTYADKYKNLIEYEILKNDKNWEDIVKIIKVESRYERE
jgi:hypothetical protein